MDSKNRLILQTALIDTGIHAINGLSWSSIFDKHELRWGRNPFEYMPLSMIFFKSTNFNAFLILLRGDFRPGQHIIDRSYALVVRWLNWGGGEGGGFHRSGFWLVPEKHKFSGTNQKPERRRPFGTGLVRHCPQGSSRRSLLFFCAIFSRPFRLSLAPTICPWVSEDCHLKARTKKWGEWQKFHFRL